MPFYADLHVHSKHSRATSRDCDLEHLALWARRKGLSVVATGDFTHPAWRQEIGEKLVPAEPGLFKLRPEVEREVGSRLPAACAGTVRFMLEVEISTIYKKGDKTRKVHHLVYAPDLDTADRFRARLARIGNLDSDGRPILGLDSRHLLETVLESGPDAYLVPAHIWTPWFAVLGSKSGFDSVEECYGDLTEHIFAVETGLSSDPPMNWRVGSLDRFTLVSSSDAHSPPALGREASVFDTELDYFAMRQALETGEGYGGTVELFPEEGKYHLDGHRACGVRLQPDETRRSGGRCPRCDKPLTVGVMHRVEALADRPEGEAPPRAAPYRSLVPLPEIAAELRGVGPRSRTVERTVGGLISRLGPELEILERLPLEEIAAAGDTLLTEAIGRLRAHRVRRQAGYDGEFGTIHLFEPGEIEARGATVALFAASTAGPQPTPEPPAPRRKPRLDPTPVVVGSPPPPREVPLTLPFGGPGAPLDALDRDQRAAAEILDGPLLVLAGPGTGKTRTLTHRLAHMVGSGRVPPESCLALTFTRRAAETMRRRLTELLPTAAGRIPVTTFHGLGLTILREQRREAGLERGFRVADESERQELLQGLVGGRRAEAGTLLARLSDARRSAAEGSAPIDDPVVDRYVATLRDRGLVDFDDLQLLPCELLARRPALAAGYRDRFRAISVDEYQDVDPVQYRLLRLLALPDANLCAIGDPDQSIYSFRGAEVGFFLRFREDYPEARVVELGRNYRSSPSVVRAACQAIAPASLVAGRRLQPVAPLAPEPIVLHEAPTVKAEAEHVAATIEACLGGTSTFSIDSGRATGHDEAALSFDDFAVLYRTTAQSEPVAEALSRAGIPFQRRSHERLLDRPGVRALVRALRAIPRSEEDRAPTVRQRLRAAAETLQAGAGDDGELALERELLAPLADRHGGDLEGFLIAISLGVEIDTWDPRAERVSLLTLHASKGLEFPVVFLVGCAEGLLPFHRAEDLAEERRLLFVGMTRAERRLILSWPRRLRRAGQLHDAGPSPFLADIEEGLLDRRCGPRRRRPGTERGPQQLRLL